MYFTWSVGYSSGKSREHLGNLLRDFDAAKYPRGQKTVDWCRQSNKAREAMEAVWDAWREVRRKQSRFEGDDVMHEDVNDRDEVLVSSHDQSRDHLLGVLQELQEGSALARISAMELKAEPQRRH